MIRNKIKALLYYLFIYPYYKLTFGKIGYKSRILKPLSLENKKRIFIGDNVFIRKFSWLSVDPNITDAELTIGNNTYIGNLAHIYCYGKVAIGNDVLLADKIYISTCTHDYMDINNPIKNQKIEKLKDVVIGDGAWIGENVCIVGVSVGKNSVIGANSVVNKDIPDFCIAVGAPAKVIKKYNFETNSWEKTNAEGVFI